MLHADLGDALYLDPDFLQALLHQGLERGLIVAFQDEASVPEPLNVLGHHSGHVLIFARAFIRDAMCEDGFAAEASHEQALDQAAFKPLLLDGCFAIRNLFLRELTSTLDATS